MPGAANREIERKFLVKQLPSNLEKFPNDSIDQGYLAADQTGLQVRLRRTGNRFWLTFKRGKSIARDEREIELTREQFENLWPATAGRRVTKRRYEVPFGAYTIEIDVYGGSNAGLIVAETEFDSEEEARNFAPPDWCGADVSGDPRYSNVLLARE